MDERRANVRQSDQPPPTPKIEVPDSSLSIVPPQDLASPHSHSSSTPTSAHPSPKNLPSPTPFSGQTAGKHPFYRGIRCRGNKWVSEIREPRKTTRIWLGTYPTPEMAATAYDVAALALKGTDATLNFPNSILSYPIPKSTSASDIRAAAARAAEALQAKPESSESPNPTQPKTEETTESSSLAAGEDQFIDEEELLNMPNLLKDMAEGMLVSPPRLKSQPSDDSPENSDSDSLWSYT
ncbi:hypothetical protein PVL29_021228 [Vitis rotundifolia]|uniref:AP2/ERF domain-containing protein n=1 Tax=Vitis rotundifolia TaxID=103349 RepID=A0AA38YZE7_VITRO|nr:hypothetical protein PVL29_021228 [Vitis rotundifolia]